MHGYDHTKIEKKWQNEWAKKKHYVTKDAKKGAKNYFLLVEFPYPSGNLHVGHWYAFAVPDILARHLRMQGKNVLYPIGFDAFGLPAENAAIKNNLNPRKWTYGNIAHMEKQITSMGSSFDWSRKVVTADPEYYKWTQWLFLQFFNNGLAYKKETAVNWCPKDKTVLANEQVVGGCCERCGTEVEQRNMLQWNIKITKYADRLVDDLNDLDWPEQIKDSQRNWIGRSEGAEIDFPLATGKKYKYVYLHGYKSGADRPRNHWYRANLEALGHEVVIPDLPNSEYPVEEEQVQAALDATNLDENTILVGHSLGGIVAMKALMKAQKKILGLVLIAPAMDPEFSKKTNGLADSGEKPFHKTFDWDLDFEKIKSLTKYRVVLSDVQESKKIPYLQGLSKKLEAKLIETKAAKMHFTADKEPEVLLSLRPAIRVFTTRPDTLFGATYMVLAPEHRLVEEFKSHIENWDEIEAYRAQASRKTELERQENKEKTGVELKGVKAINPGTKKEIPIFIADYALAHYGTGALMAVPAHDERDYAFAQKFNIPIVEVVDRGAAPIPFVGAGNLINSGDYTDRFSENAKQEITQAFGEAITTYKMRDWVVSRQRYWGVPIPIIHCPTCGDVAVPDKDLPVKLPEVKDYLPTGDGKSPLAKVKKFVDVKCPQCKGKAQRETDTFDTFVDSSWYFQRYTDPKNKKKFADAKKLDAWMPVDLYSGGAEHTTMHVLYSRFWQKAMYDLKLVKDKEPYTRRMNRSLIMGPDGQKMSKSKGNVIDPDEVVRNLGADTVRMYLAFIGPYNEVASYPWNPDGVVGVRRFLERVWRLSDRLSKKSSDDVERALHGTIKKVTDDIPQLKFNTAIASMMMLMNEAEGKGITKGQFATLLKLLAPFAPHIAEELWRSLGNKKSIHLEKWPKFDAKKTLASTTTIVIQVNGKVRGNLLAAMGASESDISPKAREVVQKWLERATVKKTIFVPNRLVNFVIDK